MVRRRRRLQHEDGFSGVAHDRRVQDRGWLEWLTVGDYSPPPLFDNEVQELIALGLVAHHDGVLTLTPKGRRIATPQHDASLDTYQHTGRSLDVRGG
jgi:hypothetical protein